MTDDKQRKAPVLRFKGFHDDWEQRKLGDVAKFAKGIGYSKNDLKESGNPIILYGRLYTNYETVIKSVDTCAQLQKNTVYSKGGEIIVPASGETAEDISIASVVEPQGIILGGDLNIIYPNTNLNSIFLALAISYGKPHTEMRKRAQGKSIVHLHNSDLSNIKLKFPAKEEQSKIAEVIEKLNSLITLQQQKLDNLIILKRAYLSMLFPTKEENNPKIRFAKFSNNWEKRKFNTFVERISNNTSCNFPNVTYDDIDSKNGILNKKVSQLSRGKHGILFQKNDILYGKLRPYLNNIIKASFKGIAVGDFWILRANEDPDFFLALIYTSRYKYITSISTGSKMPRADWKLVSNYNFYIPSIEEQKWIGNMISKLSYLILLEQKRILLFKKIKHFLLQNIFI